MTVRIGIGAPSAAASRPSPGGSPTSAPRSSTPTSSPVVTVPGDRRPTRSSPVRTAVAAAPVRWTGRRWRHRLRRPGGASRPRGDRPSAVRRRIEAAFAAAEQAARRPSSWRRSGWRRAASPRCATGWSVECSPADKRSRLTGRGVAGTTSSGGWRPRCTVGCLRPIATRIVDASGKPAAVRARVGCLCRVPRAGGLSADPFSLRTEGPIARSGWTRPLGPARPVRWLERAIVYTKPRYRHGVSRGPTLPDSTAWEPNGTS